MQGEQTQDCSTDNSCIRKFDLSDLLGELLLRSLVIEHTGPGGLFGQAADIRAFVSGRIMQLLKWMEARENDVPDLTNSMLDLPITYPPLHVAVSGRVRPPLEKE